MAVARAVGAYSVATPYEAVACTRRCCCNVPCAPVPDKGRTTTAAASAARAFATAAAAAAALFWLLRGRLRRLERFLDVRRDET